MGPHEGGNDDASRAVEVTENLGAHAGTQCFSARASIRKINSKGTAVLNARRASNRGKSKRRLKTTPVLG
jgi:hypothetical protein